MRKFVVLKQSRKRKKDTARAGEAKSDSPDSDENYYSSVVVPETATSKQRKSELDCGGEYYSSFNGAEPVNDANRKNVERRKVSETKSDPDGSEEYYSSVIGAAETVQMTWKKKSDNHKHGENYWPSKVAWKRKSNRGGSEEDYSTVNSRRGSMLTFPDSEEYYYAS